VIELANSRGRENCSGCLKIKPRHIGLPMVLVVPLGRLLSFSCLSKAPPRCPSLDCGPFGGFLYTSKGGGPCFAVVIVGSRLIGLEGHLGTPS